MSFVCSTSIVSFSQRRAWKDKNAAAAAAASVCRVVSGLLISVVYDMLFLEDTFIGPCSFCGCSQFCEGREESFWITIFLNFELCVPQSEELLWCLACALAGVITTYTGSTLLTVGTFTSRRVVQ
jgi:hypothetical protein